MRMPCKGYKVAVPGASLKPHGHAETLVQALFPTEMILSSTGTHLSIRFSVAALAEVLHCNKSL